MTEDITTVSKRARRAIEFPSILLKSFNTQHANQFDQIKNPNGIVNLGTSENKICFDILQRKLCQYSAENMPEAHTHYSTFHGTVSFQNDVASFLNRYMKPLKPFQPEDIYSMNGCGSVIDAVTFSLCDRGEGILIPAPYYGGFYKDVQLLSEAVCYNVDLSSTPRKDFDETKPFQLSVGRLELALKQAKQDGVVIRALLLTNPNNPLGYIYSQEEMKSFMEFASKHNLHVIADEIYMLSVFNSKTSMTSASAIQSSLPQNKLHMVWGFSKDFGVSGFRCGVVHTTNRAVKNCIMMIAYFKSVPAIIQSMLQLLISDFEWIDHVYLPIMHSRLQKSYQVVSTALEDIKLPFVPSVAGFFVWVDFTDYIMPLTAEKEMEFFTSMLNYGIYLAPSRAFFGKEIGWMRIIFSLPVHQCEVAMERLKKFLALKSKL